MHRETTFLELAGLPAAGKTTLAAQIRSELSAAGYRCAISAEKAAACPLTAYKGDWRFNAWTLCQGVSSILETGLNGAWDLVILDRGMVDALCWVEWSRQSGGISPAEASALEGFIRLPAWFDRTSLTVVLRSRFETALFRRGKRRGRILNERTYTELRRAYESVLARPEIAGRSLVLETDRLTRAEVLDRVLAAVLPLLPVRRLVRLV